MPKETKLLESVLMKNYFSLKMIGMYHGGLICSMEHFSMGDITHYIWTILRTFKV